MVIKFLERTHQMSVNPRESIKACVLHPTINSVEAQTFDVRDNGSIIGEAWVGVCAACVENLKKDSGYQKHIEIEVTKQIKLLHEKIKGGK